MEKKTKIEKSLIASRFSFSFRGGNGRKFKRFKVLNFKCSRSKKKSSRESLGKMYSKITKSWKMGNFFVKKII